MIFSLRATSRVALASRLVQWAAVLVLAGLVALNLGFFTLHAAQVLRYPYPLDYGEGPLLAQVNVLRGGTSLKALYGPLNAPPYMVVNYPPVYLLVTLAASYLTNNVLLAGRVVSLLASLACVGALTTLASATPTDRRTLTKTEAGRLRLSSLAPDLPLVTRLAIACAFLALPIVREWAVLMRVDMLGVALGLWGLVVVRRGVGSARVLWAVPLLLASMFTKPSLLAAPAAALVFLLVYDRRRVLLFSGALALAGGALFALMASGTHFFEHVVVANANAWLWGLALRFWREQLLIHWPLLLAALVVVVAQAQQHADRSWRGLAVPVIYTLVGGVAAVGVGKVGAYANYFLEFYAGLLWCAALTASQRQQNDGDEANMPLIVRLSSFAVPLLVCASLLRYYPTWSENYVKLAGVIEGENPARFVVGKRGVWQDLRRERQIMATLGRVNGLLVDEVHHAESPILTDIPAIAAQAGQVARLQAFEHSQVRSLWDQRDLRIDMANGRVPLVVLDYLGNWLSPEMIELIRHRYAQEGSRGGYDLYRPVAPGTLTAADMPLAEGVRIRGYYLDSAPMYPGEVVPFTLLIGANGAPLSSAPHITVTLQDANNRVVFEDTRPLVYGALQLNELPAEGVQHMQPLRLPSNLPPGTYTLHVMLNGNNDQASSAPLASLVVKQLDSAVLPNGWLSNGTPELVARPMLNAWRALGGQDRLGLPISPAVPFAGFTQQCFERGCLRQRGATVEQAPLGVWVSAGDLGANGMFARPAISPAFQPFYEAHGGVAALGEAVTNEFRSGERIVQYTRFARLERPANGGQVSFGNIGEDFMRLPGDEAYRWP